ncbi:hypothetical protein AGABI1DRAFT_114359 [Agaricus bisporus var. burnettii JB137-S8]|uniref:Aquaporin-like protein n=1 Tax=Agaricus bisporus var. burnettii (strain JB137-S8 / ATCC MYA-4627 / FGSC 10392) TaxID=597362 RepID=K5X719_AGABU|nr:uncharacterized protein AGABI1DRAFT_114359 [Agaricus bisporus var. burnettii JB137-S8]EKM78762.1 hypothetical protein AGABI1DRAFT_114359 [Agaricus bisporus var. burnettii JB137-S8]
MSPSPLVFIGDIRRRWGVIESWERQRNRKQVHWIIEGFKESLGVFLFVYPGLGSTLGFILGGITETVGYSSIFQIGLSYGFGILLALGVPNGGHFNPAVSVVQTIFRGFPARKALWFIACQIFGAYVGCMLVYYQWEPLIKEMVAAGNPAAMFTANGAPGAFALYQNPEVGLGPTFLNEFVGSFVIGITIWATLDPTNLIIPPSQAVFYVSAAYVSVIWGFAVPGVALNTARDLGGRFWAMTIWGSAASGGRYAAIAALTNILATIFAVVVYELFLVDSDNPVTPDALLIGRLMHGNRRLHPQEIPEIEVDADDKGRPSSTEKSVDV